MKKTIKVQITTQFNEKLFNLFYDIEKEHLKEELKSHFEVGVEDLYDKKIKIIPLPVLEGSWQERIYPLHSDKTLKNVYLSNHAYKAKNNKYITMNRDADNDNGRPAPDTGGIIYKLDGELNIFNNHLLYYTDENIDKKSIICSSNISNEEDDTNILKNHTIKYKNMVYFKYDYLKDQFPNIVDVSVLILNKLILKEPVNHEKLTFSVEKYFYSGDYPKRINSQTLFINYLKN